jgi:hypothetical protein
VVEISEEPNGTMALVLYRDYAIRFPKRGQFRIDSMPREFRVMDGEAEVSYLGEKCTLVKDQKVSLYGGLEAQTLHRSITDGLDEWSMRRDTQMAADNPPPGDLNGDPYDPMFAIPGGAFSGLSSYSSSLPVSVYSYSPYAYSPYFPGITNYPYGFAPLPIYVYGGTYGRGYGSGNPIIYRPPVRLPIRSPILGYPRGSLPSVGRPVTPLRPVVVGHPK